MSEERDTAAATATLVENERVKLIATLLNTLASGSVLAGIVIPAASMIAGTVPSGTSTSGLSFLIGAVSWLSGGVVLHLIAQRVLRRLRA